MHKYRQTAADLDAQREAIPLEAQWAGVALVALMATGIAGLLVAWWSG